MYDIPRMWNLKINGTNELIKKKERLKDLESGLMVDQGENERKE